MTDLSIGNDTFRVEVEGDATKPALLLSHSLGADLTLWDAQMPELLKTFRVIRYDSRGHGGSTITGGPYSIARLGRDALGILDALEIETVHFMGISMGGAVGLWLLAHAPHRIERIVLANTTAHFGIPDTWNQRIVTVLDQGMAAIADSAMSRWFSPDYAMRERDRVRAVRAVFETTSPQGYAGCCAALRDLDLRTAVKTVSTPVLVISGADDASIAEADVADLVAHFTQAKHVELVASHISNIEAEAAFTKAAIAFLTAKSPARRIPAKRTIPTATRPAPTGVRRVGIRRATAARIPLAPTTSASKSGSRSIDKSVAAKAVSGRTDAPRPKATVTAPAKGRSGRATAPAPVARTTTKRGAIKPVVDATAKAKTIKTKSAKARIAETKTARAKGEVAQAKPVKAVVAKAKTGKPTTAKADTSKVKTSASKTSSVTKTKATKTPTSKTPAKKMVTQRKSARAIVAKVPPRRKPPTRDAASPSASRLSAKGLKAMAAKGGTTKKGAPKLAPTAKRTSGVKAIAPKPTSKPGATTGKTKGPIANASTAKRPASKPSVVMVRAAKAAKSPTASTKKTSAPVKASARNAAPKAVTTKTAKPNAPSAKIAATPAKRGKPVAKPAVATAPVARSAAKLAAKGATKPRRRA